MQRISNQHKDWQADYNKNAKKKQHEINWFHVLQEIQQWRKISD